MYQEALLVDKARQVEKAREAEEVVKSSKVDESVASSHTAREAGRRVLTRRCISS